MRADKYADMMLEFADLMYSRCIDIGVLDSYCARFRNLASGNHEGETVSQVVEELCRRICDGERYPFPAYSRMLAVKTEFCEEYTERNFPDLDQKVLAVLESQVNAFAFILARKSPLRCFKFSVAIPMIKWRWLRGLRILGSKGALSAARFGHLRAASCAAILAAIYAEGAGRFGVSFLQNAVACLGVQYVLFSILRLFPSLLPRWFNW